MQVTPSRLPNRWALYSIFVTGIVYGLYLTLSSWVSGYAYKDMPTCCACFRRVAPGRPSVCVRYFVFSLKLGRVCCDESKARTLWGGC